MKRKGICKSVISVVMALMLVIGSVPATTLVTNAVEETVLSETQETSTEDQEKEETTFSESQETLTETAKKKETTDNSEETEVETQTESESETELESESGTEEETKIQLFSVNFDDEDANYTGTRFYNLSDGSVVSKDYKYGNSVNIITSEDGYLQIDGKNSMYHNGGELAISAGQTFSIKVPGNVDISIQQCMFGSGGDLEITGNPEGSKLSSKKVSYKGSECKSEANFSYVGPATTLVLTVTGSGYIHGLRVTTVESKPAEEGPRKIDVWDIGAKSENSSLYNNHITKEAWEKTGIAIDEKLPTPVTATFGDAQFLLHDGDKICGSVGMNASESKYSQIKYSDGYTSSAVWHTNGKGNNSRRCIVIRDVMSSDRISVYMGSHTKEAEKLYFEYIDSNGKQCDSLDITSRCDDMINKVGERYDFIAKYDGKYRIYVGSSDNLKPVYHRLVRVPSVEVSGNVDVSSTTAKSEKYALKFVNNNTGDETTAKLDGNKFSVRLTPGYEYTAVITGVVGVAISKNSRIVDVKDSEVLSGHKGVTLKAEEKNVYKLSGSLKGFDSDVDMSKVKVTLVAPKDSYKDDITLKVNADKSFTEYLEPNIEYTVTLENANDYMAETKVIKLSNDTDLDIDVTKKPKYKIIGKFKGLPASELISSITFTNVDDDYSYTGISKDGGYEVELRDGAYSVKAASGTYTTSTHVVVDGKAVTRDLLFVTSKVEAKTLVKDIYVGYSDKKNNYESVRDAIAACKAMNPKSEEDRITVHIAPGVYREQVIIETPYITLVNDNPDREVKLTWYYGVGYKYYSADKDGYYNAERDFDKFEKKTIGKWGSATYIKNKAVGFRAKNITFETSFNRYLTEEELKDGVEVSGESTSYVRKLGVDVTSKASTERACALAVEANHAEFFNCKVLGSQDTLYTGGEVVIYFKDCKIEGNTDYIFGGADVVFEECELSFYGYSDNAGGGYITAAAEPYKYGYVFNNCKVTGNKELTVKPGYFGRPWRQVATVSFINTELENNNLINPVGWASMSGSTPEAANYKEYNTTLADGTLADVSKRTSGTVCKTNPILDASEVFGDWTPHFSKEVSDNKDDKNDDKDDKVEETVTESVDLTGGLIAGKTYGNSKAVNITVLEDMLSKAEKLTVNGKNYSVIVAGKNNPNPGKGKVPETGAVLKVEAVTDATLMLVTRNSTGKKFYVLEVSKDGKINAVENGTVEDVEYVLDGEGKKIYQYSEDTYELKAGNTYYAYRDGSKMTIADISYTFTNEVENKDDQKPELPKVLAFEGAEGGGRFATGGRGGDVYVVTSLEDYSAAEKPIEGTLRYGVQTAGQDGRIIVFNVGGTIHLKQTLGFSGKKNITIAGQTAPGDGITLAGYDTNISDSENIIIRFVRFRVGTENLLQGGDSMDALWGRDNDTFMIDHCTFSWNTDETLSTYRGKNGTVQWCLISESLTVSGHSKGRHGYGGIWGGDNTVFQYNLIANHTSRNPRIGGGSMTDPTGIESYATLQLSNNVLYNWGYFGCYGGGYTWTNFLNNYLKAGRGTRDAQKNTVIDFGENGKIGGVYVDGNYLVGNSTISANNEKGSTYVGSTTTKADKPYESEAFDNVTLMSAKDCYPLVLAKSGATYPRRDAIDARVVSEVLADRGSYINTQDEVGGYCMATVKRDDDFDTDGDGIPDNWEKSNGLDPKDPSDSVKLSKNGYAYVEEYFNELVKEVVAKDYEAKNPIVTIDLKDNTLINEGEEIEVAVSTKATNGGNIAKVEFFNGAKKVATVNKAPYNYTYKDLKDGTYHISVRAFDNDGNATQSSTSRLHVNSTVGTGDWTSNDIGNPGIKGAASLVNGVMTVKGAGKLGKSEGSVSGKKYASAKSDDFNFVYQKVNGNVELVTRLDSFNTVDSHTFNGIMYRDSLDYDAATVALGLSMVKINSTSIWSVYMVNRANKGANISEISETIDGVNSAKQVGIPIVTDLNFKTGNTFTGMWLKLTRDGNKFAGYVSEDGKTWTKVGELSAEISQDAYLGFAIDANKAANNIENYATAKFSNIKMNTEFVTVTYDTKNISVAGADKLAIGDDLCVTLKNTKGYLLPNSIKVTMAGKEADFTYDSKTGVISLANVTGDVVVKAEGIERKIEKVKYSIVDEPKLLTVEEKDGKIILDQKATTGSVAKNITTPAVNESYLVFPAVDKFHTMSLKLKVTGLTQTNKPNETGIFVGIHDIKGNAYTTLGFRPCAAESLCGYWMKSAVKSGNGSPKLAVSVGTTYDILFKTNGNGGYIAKFSSNDGKIKDVSKEFKANESYLQAGDLVQYGIGLIGASCEITDMKLVDHESNVIYDQNESQEETSEEETTQEKTSEEESTEVETSSEESTEEKTTEVETTHEETSSEETSNNTKPENPSQNTSNSEGTNTGLATVLSSVTVTISENEVPLSDKIDETTIDGIEYTNINISDKKALLKVELLSKYYCLNKSLLVHTGNGVGFTMLANDLNSLKSDIDLTTKLDKLSDFAEGFTSYMLVPNTRNKLNFSIGVNVKVGKEHANKTAYIYELNNLENGYEIKSIQTVNQDGNVGLFTDKITSLVILIKQ